MKQLSDDMGMQSGQERDVLVTVFLANIEFKVPYSQRYLVLGLVGLVGLRLPLLLGLVG